MNVPRCRSSTIFILFDVMSNPIVIIRDKNHYLPRKPLQSNVSYIVCFALDKGIVPCLSGIRNHDSIF